MAKSKKEIAFQKFKKECLRQLERLGLTDWDVSVVLGKTSHCDAQAESEFSDGGRMVIVTLNDDMIIEDPERVAKHEVGHILLARLERIASKRWGNEKELEEEMESLCTKFEKVF